MGLCRTSTITFYLILEQSSARNIFYKLEHVIVKFLLAFFEWTNSYMIDFVMCKHVQTIFICWSDVIVLSLCMLQHQFLDIHVSLYFSRIMGKEERLCVLSWLLIASYARWLFYVLLCQEIYAVKCIHWENRFCEDDDMKLISLDVETKGLVGTENCFREGEYKTDSYYFLNKKMCAVKK